MKKKVLRCVYVVFFVFVVMSSYQGTVHSAIYSENFNTASGTGPWTDYSQKWSSTTYYLDKDSASLTGWTFSGSAFVAEDANNSSDRAILLNEYQYGHGSMSASIPVTSGGQYVLTFDYWGDNRPGKDYLFDVSIGSNTYHLGGNWQNSGYGTWTTAPFTAGGDSVIISFTSTSTTEASVIIDNMNISAVPIPPTVLLLGAGLLGLVGVRRRFKK